MKKVVVIGAGASGMMAAITAAECGAPVTLLERMEKPGKKLLITGSGRCNLTNLDQKRSDAYRSVHPKAVQKVIDTFSVAETLAFFEHLGLLTMERDGYVYPYSGQASSVLDVLQRELKKRSVKLKCTEKVQELFRDKKGWKVRTQGWTYEADAVILTGGSKAASATGSDGNTYALAEKLGHTVLTPLPALVPLKIKEAWIRKLSGLRMAAEIKLTVENLPRFAYQKNSEIDQNYPMDKNICTEEEQYLESGELQWTDYGISGIVVFQLSRYAAAALNAGRKVTVSINLFPKWSREDLLAHLRQRSTDGSCEEFLYGLLPKKAIVPILERLKIKPGEKAQKQFPQKAEELAKLLTNLPLTVIGTQSYEQAQVCQGGVDLAEIDTCTMESRLHSGLYFAGEVLDVDGICGGYNLQWAWSSGHLAGVSCMIQ